MNQDRRRLNEVLNEIMNLRSWAKAAGQQWLVDELKNRLMACDIEVIDTIEGKSFCYVIPLPPPTDLKEKS